MVSGLLAFEFLIDYPSGISGLGHPELVRDYLQEFIESGSGPDRQEFRFGIFHESHVPSPCDSPACDGIPA